MWIRGRKTECSAWRVFFELTLSSLQIVSTDNVLTIQILTNIWSIKSSRSFTLLCTNSRRPRRTGSCSMSLPSSIDISLVSLIEMNSAFNAQAESVAKSHLQNMMLGCHTNIQAEDIWRKSKVICRCIEVLMCTNSWVASRAKVVGFNFEELLCFQEPTFVAICPRSLISDQTYEANYMTLLSF